MDETLGKYEIEIQETQSKLQVLPLKKKGRGRPRKPKKEKEIMKEEEEDVKIDTDTENDADDEEELDEDDIEAKRKLLKEMYLKNPDLINNFKKVKLPNISKMDNDEIEQRLLSVKIEASKLLDHDLSNKLYELGSTALSTIYDEELKEDLDEDEQLKDTFNSYLSQRIFINTSDTIKLGLLLGGHVLKANIRKFKKKPESENVRE